MSCVSRLGRVCHYCCYDEEGDDDDDDSKESLEEQSVSSFWTEREEKKLDSLQSYTQVPNVAEQESALDSKYDPDEEYIKNFERLGWHSENITSIGVSSIGVEKLAIEAEQFLSTASSETLTPREIRLRLNQYSTYIRLTNDLEKKKSYIQRYEVHKFDLDEDNIDDKEKADLYLTEARNTDKKATDRLEYYQIAIKFTNNYAQKQLLKEEYRRYAYSLGRRRD